MPASATSTIQFAERIFEILQHGSKSATYKYALLLALLDLCLEKTNRAGAPPNAVTTAEIADKVIELYWPQAEPFRKKGDPLQQFTDKGKQAFIITLIARFKAGRSARSSLAKVRSREKKAYESLRSQVEWVFVKDPLPRLQLIGSEAQRFIYEIGWDTSITKTKFKTLSNVVHFVDDSADHIRQLNNLLRPLLRQEWIRMVARINKTENKLEEYLFPPGRKSLEDVRDPLLELQHGRCFYCDRAIRSGTEVDHFIPHARCAYNGLGNLVAAHKICNGRKSDFFAATEHLARWVERLETKKAGLQQIAHDESWEFDPRAARGLTTSVYLGIPAGTHLWQLGKEFVQADQQAIRATLGIPE